MKEASQNHIRMATKSGFTAPDRLKRSRALLINCEYLDGFAIRTGLLINYLRPKFERDHVARIERTRRAEEK